MRPCVTPPLIIRGTEFGGAKPVFCIPLVARDLKQLVKQARVARRLEPDAVEWRADSYDESNGNSLVEASRTLRSVLDREPVVFTLRISTEGGAKPIGQDVRTQCISAVLRSGLIDLVDVELSNGSRFLQPIIETAHEHGVRVILSFHDFETTPSNEVLLDAISAMIRDGADIAKIACMPRDPGDVLRLLQVTFAARQAFPSIPLCTMSMGSLGSWSRVAGFLCGNDMAFAVGQEISAPGQLPIADARAMTEALLRCGVYTGNPKTPPSRTHDDFKSIYEQSGFWSCCGYDGLSMVFDIPLDDVRSLSEEQKRALMRLLNQLADGADEALQGQTRELESLTAKERFIRLVSLSAPFA